MKKKGITTRAEDPYWKFLLWVIYKFLISYLFAEQNRGPIVVFLPQEIGHKIFIIITQDI